MCDINCLCLNVLLGFSDYLFNHAIRFYNNGLRQMNIIVCVTECGLRVCCVDTLDRSHFD